MKGIADCFSLSVLAYCTLYFAICNLFFAICNLQFPPCAPAFVGLLAARSQEGNLPPPTADLGEMFCNFI